tara:strand:+ start:51 stop:461 length:411 start_codon:yes stop_codon:yes gene_type:complete
MGGINDATPAAWDSCYDWRITTKENLEAAQEKVEAIRCAQAEKAEHEEVTKFLEEFRMDDPVNKPDHYNVGEIETIDYIVDVLGKYEAISYCHGNVIKYTGSRLWTKGNPIQDAEKAQWYLNKMIELMKETKGVNW